MADYSRDAETAAIMALAPVIPVLTVAERRGRPRSGEGAGGGRPLAIEVTLAHRRARSRPSLRSQSRFQGAVVGAGTIASPRKSPKRSRRARAFW